MIFPKSDLRSRSYRRSLFGKILDHDLDLILDRFLSKWSWCDRRSQKKWSVTTLNHTHHFSNFVVHICTQIVYENHEETVHVHTGIVCATIVFPVRTLLGAVRLQSICKKSGYLFPTAILLKINFIWIYSIFHALKNVILFLICVFRWRSLSRWIFDATSGGKK